MAAIYPPQLVDAICKGINEQIKADKFDQNIIARVEYLEGSNVLAEVQKAKENAAKCHEDDHRDLIAFDDVSGAELDPKMVQKARRDEIEYVRSMNLYTKVKISECLKYTGKKPIAVRWIDVNKGDAKNPNVRSRVVGKEFNTYNDVTLYAATPPLEACLLYTSPSPRDQRGSRMPSSA